MFYGRKCKIFIAVMPTKSLPKKLNFVKKKLKIEGFIAVFTIQPLNQDIRYLNGFEKQKSRL